MKIQILLLTTLFFLSSILCQLYAQTEVMGGIFEDTNWTMDGSPYLVVDDLVVLEDVILTIEPGVEVLVSADVEIEIRNSTLIAIGTETNPIKITSDLQDDNRTYWKGFKVKGLVDISTPSTQINMAYCQLSNADLLFDLDHAHHSNYFNHVTFIYNNEVNYQVGQSGFPTQFTNCTFMSNNRGPHVQGHSSNIIGIIDNCHFENNVIGVHAGRVTNSSFTGHSEYAVFMYEKLVNCEIWDNNIGVVSDNHGDTEVTNNYIHDNNVGVEISRFWNDPRVVFEDNRICDNAEWNIDYKYENAADLTKNCWCLDNEDEIKATIRDAYFDLSLGVISVDPTYDNCSLMTSNETPKVDDLFNIYPNPSKDRINIDYPSLGANLEYAIYDALGAVRKTGILEQTSIEVADFAAGLYLIKIFDTDNKNALVQKFTKY